MMIVKPDDPRDTEESILIDQVSLLKSTRAESHLVGVAKVHELLSVLIISLSFLIFLSY